MKLQIQNKLKMQNIDAFRGPSERIYPQRTYRKQRNDLRSCRKAGWRDGLALVKSTSHEKAMSTCVNLHLEASKALLIS